MIKEDMERLSILKKELKSEKAVFDEKVQPLRDEIKVLEASIRTEVMKAAKTIIIGDIKAEYIPQVVIRFRKQKEQ